jgi:hypothetical protein
LEKREKKGKQIRKRNECFFDGVGLANKAEGEILGEISMVFIFL